jgi:hypothetical protein
MVTRIQLVEFLTIIRAPSVVSSKHIPAVNRTGKIIINQRLVPFVAWMDEIPRIAISELVSDGQRSASTYVESKEHIPNPNPKRTPGFVNTNSRTWK